MTEILTRSKFAVPVDVEAVERAWWRDGYELGAEILEPGMSRFSAPPNRRPQRARVHTLAQGRAKVSLSGRSGRGYLDVGPGDELTVPAGTYIRELCSVYSGLTIWIGRNRRRYADLADWLHGLKESKTSLITLSVGLIRNCAEPETLAAVHDLVKHSKDPFYEPAVAVLKQRLARLQGREMMRKAWADSAFLTRARHPVPADTKAVADTWWAEGYDSDCIVMPAGFSWRPPGSWVQNWRYAVVSGWLKLRVANEWIDVGPGDEVFVPADPDRRTNRVSGSVNAHGDTTVWMCGWQKPWNGVADWLDSVREREREGAPETRLAAIVSVLGPRYVNDCSDKQVLHEALSLLGRQIAPEDVALLTAIKARLAELEGVADPGSPAT